MLKIGMCEEKFVKNLLKTTSTSSRMFKIVGVRKDFWIPQFIIREFLLEWAVRSLFFQIICCVPVILLKGASFKLILKAQFKYFLEPFLHHTVENLIKLVMLVSTVLFVVIIIVKSSGLQSLKGHLAAKRIAYFPISSPPVLSIHQDNDFEGFFPQYLFFIIVIFPLEFKNKGNHMW